MTQNDPTCRICLTNTANKKNSHLIPWFLIKNSITRQGAGNRDTEITFSINPKARDTVFLGRSILPENASEILVKDLIKEDLTNPFARDYLFCPKCEDKLGRLESIFATRLSKKKISSFKEEDLVAVGKSSILVDKEYNENIFSLFIQSIFYRCSIGRFSSVELDLKTEKLIERNLRLCFSIDAFDSLTHRSELPKINQFPILATCFKTPISPGKNTEGFIFQNRSSIPYFIMAGNWTFQLYKKSTHLSSSVERLYGLSTFHSASKAYEFIKQSAHAVLLDGENESKFRKNVLDYFVNQRMTSRKRLIRQIYQKIFERKATAEIHDNIFRQFNFYISIGKDEYESMQSSFADFVNSQK
jgi:hypothetical protein